MATKVYLRGRDDSGGRSSALTDITAICSGVDLQGQVQGASRKMAFDVMRKGQDYYLGGIADIQRGDAIALMDGDSTSLDDARFYGLVWRIDEADNDALKSVTCYDNMKFLMKSEVITNVFTDMTAPEITRTVCKELGVTVGTLPESDVKVNVNARGKSGYEAIMIAWTETRKETDKYYHARMVGYKFCVIEKGELLEGKTLVYRTQDLPCSLISVTMAEDSEDAVTSLWERSESGPATFIENDDELVALLGYIVGMNDSGQTSDQDNVKAINDGKVTLSVEAIGDWAVQTGWSIALKSKTVTADRLYIESDRHHYANGIHTMTLELSYENSMDEQESAPEQETDETGTGVGGPEGDGIATGSMGWPLAGGVGTVTQGFGGGHRGVDISSRSGAGAGATMVAIDGGTVVSAGNGVGSWTYGNVVVIDHGNGLFSRYAHMYSISVSAGQKVSKGQALGVEGSTGNSSGTHVHLELLSGGVWGTLLNPLSYISRYG